MVFAARRAAQADVSATIGVNFTALTLDQTQALGQSWTPPNNDAGVGPGSVAELVNGAFAVYSKTDGSQIGSTITDLQFWTNAGISSSLLSAEISDPRIMYDPASGRWFASEMTLANHSNQIMVAVSQTSDPSGPWQAVHFDSTDTNQAADFPTLGVNGDRVVIGGDMFAATNSGTHDGESLFSIPKSSLLASTPTTEGMSRFDDFFTSSSLFVPQPASGANTGQESVLAVSASTSKMSLITINESPTGDTLTGPFDVSSNSYNSPPKAHQPDGTQQIDTIDNRLASAVTQVGNYLYTVAVVGTGGNHAELRWAKVDITTQSTIAGGTLGGGTGKYDFFDPSIAVGSTGAIVIGCNRSGDSATGSDGNISSYAFIGVDSGGANVSFDSPILLASGAVDDFHLLGASLERWGDFSSTWVDPTNPDIFWTTQEIPLAADDWGTQITELEISLPEPGSICIVAGLVALVQPRRRGNALLPD